jgi:5-aminopentanamidase
VQQRRMVQPRGQVLDGRDRLPFVPAALRVAALELPARWNDRTAALADVDRLLSSAPPPDLALLPEASLTGYVSPGHDFDLSAFAEPLDGPTSEALSALAQKHRCALAGPLIEKDGARCFNAFVVFAADGARIAHYRKRRPWFPETWATPGSGPATPFDVRGVSVTIAICFDVHTLAADAGRELRAADVLLFPSAWVDDGDDSRGDILPEVARAFDVSVVNANWGLGSPRVRGQGGSRIVGRDGRILAIASRSGRIDATLSGK